MSDKKTNLFIQGLKDGFPIGLGYLAVSFTLGIQCREAGLTALEATVMSLVNLTSAGEFAALAIIKAASSYLEMAVYQLIINLRYMLMSFALSQKVEPGLSAGHRCGMAFGVTDEIFGISIGLNGRLKPAYSYGAMAVAIPGWTIGTLLGVVMGNVLPEAVVNALSLALYGMFIAIIVPQAKEDKHVAAACVIAMVSSSICTYAPVVKDISAGSRIIILTVVISLVAALIWPVKEEASSEKAETEAEG